MTQIVESFRIRLEKALTANNMKPIELAEKAGISQSTISQYRSGYSKPKAKRLVKIAEILHVNPAWLMGLDVPEEPQDLSVGTYNQCDQSFDSVPVSLREDELRLLNNYNRLNTYGKEKAIEYVEDLVGNVKYTEEKSLDSKDVG